MVTAQMRATIHPMIDHPSRMFITKMAVPFRFFDDTAMIDGRRYSPITSNDVMSAM